MRSPLAVFLAALVATLCACERQPSDAKALLEQSPPPPDTSPEPLPLGREGLQVREGGKGLLKAEFLIPSCAHRVSVRLVWNVAPAGMDAAEVWVGPEHERQIVSAGGTTHTITTPAWAGPGEIFTLRSTGGAEELDRVTLPGERCPGT